MANIRNLLVLSATTLQLPTEASLEGTNLGDLMKEARAEEAKEAKKRAGEEALEMVRTLEKRKQGLRAEVKDLKRQTQFKVDELGRLDRALAYGEETGNYVPLITALGLYSYEAEKEVGYDELRQLREIPKDWQPKAKHVG